MISDAKSHLSQDIQVFIQDNDITPEVASSFLISIKEENLKVTSDNFLEFSKLSDFFQVKRFLKKLNHFYQLQKNDPDFYINAIINDINGQKMFSDCGFQTSIEMQNYLSKQISACLQKEKFSKLPVSIIYNIIEKSDKTQLSPDLLFNFIKILFENLYILLNFLDLHNLSDQNFKELYGMYLNAQNSHIDQYFSFLPVNIHYIKSLKENMEQIKKLLTDLEQDKEQFQSKINYLEQNKEQFQNKINDLEQDKEKFQSKEIGRAHV